MDLTKHGFDKKINGVKYLEAIFDLLEGKYRYELVRGSYYFICDEDLENKEIVENQRHLFKKFYMYKNHRINNYCKGVYTTQKYNEEKLKEQKEKEAEEERWRKIREAKAKKEEERKKHENEEKGIYGIYNKDNILIYVGKTMVGFETRFKQHKEMIEKKSTTQYLYKYITKNYKDDEIYFKPIITLSKLKTKDKITNRDLEAMELALITLYQPICNVQGK